MPPINSGGGGGQNNNNRNDDLANSANNPVLTAYEDFVRDTPFVTRSVLMINVATWWASLFVDVSLGLANVPLFTVQRFELYRIVTSPFVCEGLLSLVFVFLSFRDVGTRLERAVGSAAFGALLLFLGAFSNVLFATWCYALAFATNNDALTVTAAGGVWTTIVLVVAVECADAPPDAKRRLFFAEIPTMYYPAALTALLWLFGSANASHVVSLVVGHAHGKGRLDRLRPSPGTVRRWETDGCLSNLARREGWVPGHAATGRSTTVPSSLSSSLPLWSGGGNDDNENNNGRSTTTNNNNDAGVPKARAFPSSGGRTLGGGGGGGGATRRDAVAARLERLEQSNGGGGTNGGGSDDVPP